MVSCAVNSVMRVAIDTGGTFTDCVYLCDGMLQAVKVLSTPDDPGRAVLNVLRAIGIAAPLVVRHGTTVGTNAMLERKGARVAFVTTAGFEDTIAIGRQARSKLYDWFQAPPPCLVPEALRFGLRERTSAEGACLERVDGAELEQLVERIRESGAESIAVSLLFSFVNPDNERRTAAALEKLLLPLSISHCILPEFREFERASTVVANAYLAPKVGAYLGNLTTALGSEFPDVRLEVMQSSGGILPAHVAAAEPVRTVLSGPAGGVVAAYKLAAMAGFEKIIGFDMGGTSTDVSLVDGTAGGLRAGNESTVAGIPIAIPMLNIHTVGAGGGSIARFDAGAMLRVGPESAASMPGPICFGRGELPTVTDANLVLGRLDRGSFLSGAVNLHADRAWEWMDKAKGSMATVQEFAAGVVRVVEASMIKAIRVISVEKGYDPRDFTLVAFGGGGPVHACSLARELRVPRVLVPAMPGALSAAGILLADTAREYSRTVMLPVDALDDSAFEELEAAGVEDFRKEGLAGVAWRSVDLRYRGQGYELNIPYSQAMAEPFHELHKNRYGFSDLARPLEAVNVRVRMVAPAEDYDPRVEAIVAGNGSAALQGTRLVYFDGEFQDTRIYDRSRLHPGDSFAGPAIVVEYSSATLVPPHDVLRVDGWRNLVIEVH